jgi:hypothetical protein
VRARAVGGHVAALQLAGAAETCGNPGAVPSREAGAGAAGTRGSLGAAPSREMEAGAIILT